MARRPFTPADVDLVSYDDAQAFAKCGRTKLKQMLRDGQLKRYKIGRSTRIDRNELARVMADAGR